MHQQPQGAGSPSGPKVLEVASVGDLALALAVAATSCPARPNFPTPFRAPTGLVVGQVRSRR